MTNREFIDKFVSGNLKQPACCNHLLAVNDRLYSYSTEILHIDVENRLVEFNTAKYSRTTSKHQTMIRRSINVYLPSFSLKEYDGDTNIYYWNYGYQGADVWRVRDIKS